MPQFDAMAYQQRLIEGFRNRAAIDLLQNFITVSAGADSCRIAATRVSSVDALPVSTPIPRALPWVLGVVSVRGRILILVHFEHLLHGQRAHEPGYCLSLHDSPYALAVSIDLADANAPIVDLAAVLPVCAIDPGAVRRTIPSAPAADALPLERP